MSRTKSAAAATDAERLEDLGRTARKGRSRGPAPVHRWNPPYCGEIGLGIAADGVWHYQGSPIRRASLVRLFASVLRKDDDGRHYLVTPVEKIGIDVADAPFQAVTMRAEGERRKARLVFETDVGDEVTAGLDHPLRFEREAGTDGLKPYVLVRGRLEARLTRPLAYDLAQLVEEEDGVLGVWSGGRFFSIAEAAAREAAS